MHKVVPQQVLCPLLISLFFLIQPIQDFHLTPQSPQVDLITFFIKNSIIVHFSPSYLRSQAKIVVLNSSSFNDVFMSWSKITMFYSSTHEILDSRTIKTNHVFVIPFISLEVIQCKFFSFVVPIS